MLNLNPLKQYVEIFGKEKIFEWIFLSPNIYYRPLYFFNKIFQKSSKEKLTLSLFYFSIPSILYYIFSNLSIKEVLRQSIIEISALIIAFCILNFTRIIIKKKYQIEFKSENIFYFLVITKALSLPFQIIFFIIFNFSEKYEFLFIHNLVLPFLGIFIFIFSNKFFYIQLKYIIIGAILNITFFNIFLFTLDKINFDEYLADFQLILQTDEINDEFNLKISSCDSLWTKFPKKKFLVSMDYDSQVFSFYTFKKTAFNKTPNITSELLTEDENFKKGVIQKIKDDSITNFKFRFSRNKQYNEKLISYLRELKKDIKNPYIESKTKIKSTATVSAKTGKDKANYYELTLDDNVYKKYISFSDEIISFYDEKEFAEYPKYALIIIAFPYAIYYETK
jgi:hypothetical protein